MDRKGFTKHLRITNMSQPRAKELLNLMTFPTAWGPWRVKEKSLKKERKGRYSPGLGEQYEKKKSVNRQRGNFPKGRDVRATRIAWKSLSRESFYRPEKTSKVVMSGGGGGSSVMRVQTVRRGTKQQADKLRGEGSPRCVAHKAAQPHKKGKSRP